MVGRCIPTHPPAWNRHWARQFVALESSQTGREVRCKNRIFSNVCVLKKISPPLRSLEIDAAVQTTQHQLHANNIPRPRSSLTFIRGPPATPPLSAPAWEGGGPSLRIHSEGTIFRFFAQATRGDFLTTSIAIVISRRLGVTFSPPPPPRVDLFCPVRHDPLDSVAFSSSLPVSGTVFALLGVARHSTIARVQFQEEGKPGN